MDLIAVLVGLAAMMLAEETCRHDSGKPPDLRRAATNFGLGLANLGMALLVPLGAVAAALSIDHGPLAAWSAAAAFVPLLIARSFAAYWLHRLFHWQPLLWRIHRVHHGDTEIDTSTGLRNHPLEAVLATATAAGVVLALAPPLGTVIAVDTLLLVAAFWQHAAIRLPGRLADRLERLVVTPRFHLAHHAEFRALHDSNYGDLTTVWDRLFGTLATQRPATFAIGLGASGASAQSLTRQLAWPFLR